MSNVQKLIESSRSYRRFSQLKRPSEKQLLEMINAARLSPSAANLQRLRFTPIFDTELCKCVFENIAFAAYLGAWRPSDDEKPTAYIVVWTENEPDTNLAIDIGIAAQSILLTAREMGFGGCMFRSIKKNELKASLGKEDYVPVLVIALGEPSETVVLTKIKDGNLKYYRDENGTHFVPKRDLRDVVI